MGCCCSCCKEIPPIPNTHRIIIIETHNYNDADSFISDSERSIPEPERLSQTMRQNLITSTKEIFEFYDEQAAGNDTLSKCYGMNAFLPTSFYRFAGICISAREELAPPTLLTNFLLCAVDYFRFSKKHDDFSPLLLPKPSVIGEQPPELRHYIACQNEAMRLANTAEFIYITPGIAIICDILIRCIKLVKPAEPRQPQDRALEHLLRIWNLLSTVLSELSNLKGSSEIVSIPSYPSLSGFKIQLSLFQRQVVNALHRMTSDSDLEEAEE
jgi:hypothetical protein